jgi:hypothetical protein
VLGINSVRLFASKDAVTAGISTLLSLQESDPPSGKIAIAELWPSIACNFILDGDYRLTLRFLTMISRAGMLLCLSLCIDMSLPAAPVKCAIVADGPDAQVKEFCLDDLEARLQTMQAGPERDYFADVRANRTGHLEDSIRLLRDALPNIRLSEPAQAAIALEALADDYNKSFRYDDAARTYDDLGRLGSDAAAERGSGADDHVASPGAVEDGARCHWLSGYGARGEWRPWAVVAVGHGREFLGRHERRCGAARAQAAARVRADHGGRHRN